MPPRDVTRATYVAGALIASALLTGCSHHPSLALAPEGSGRGTVAPSSVSPAEGPAKVRPLAKSLPVRVEVPAIGVDSQLMSLGLQADGTLEVPPGAFPAGWYTGAPTPGEVGPAIIAGHVSYNGVPGVFADLGAVRVDDEVTVARADGTDAVFRVTRVAHFAKDAFPSEVVYGNVEHPALRLITCGGFNSDTGSFDDNVVVFARLVASA